MTITLGVNPYGNRTPREYRNKVFKSRIRVNPSSDFPTRIRGTWPNGEAGSGFLNLVEVTTDNDDERRALANQPFLLRLEGHKIFVLRRRYSDQMLRIWFIVKERGDASLAEEGDEEKLEADFTGNLVLTIETDEETIESTPAPVEVGATFP